MASSDSASSLIPKKASKLKELWFCKYIAKYIRNTLLSRKQTVKKVFDTNSIFFAFLQA